MRELALALGEMVRLGVIKNYALFGAIAQMRYTAPVATLDADVLVALADERSLDPLRAVYQFCQAHGWPAEGEAIRIGSWPTQFIPAFDALTHEALELAEVADFEGVALRVVRAEHLAVIALSVGRGKDFARVLALLESGAVSRLQIAGLASRHGLAAAWERFEARFLDA